MNIELSEGFCKTIADILDYCVEGHTDSCTIKMNVNAFRSIKNRKRIAEQGRYEKAAILN